MILNFNNQVENDDEQLIRWLKEQTTERPPGHLVENTMERFMALQSEKKFSYKPLKAPLYMLMAMALLLVLPLWIPTFSNSSFLNSINQILGYPSSIVLKYGVLCWFTIVAIWMVALFYSKQNKSHYSYQSA